MHDIYEMDATKECSGNGCVQCYSYLIYEFPKGTILIIEIVRRALFFNGGTWIPMMLNQKISSWETLSEGCVMCIVWSQLCILFTGYPWSMLISTSVFNFFHLRSETFIICILKLLEDFLKNISLFNFSMFLQISKAVNSFIGNN